ncbi:hypothetical protein ACM66B_004149 [Microbotryomycetes sp. NB124-2]
MAPSRRKSQAVDYREVDSDGEVIDEDVAAVHEPVKRRKKNTTARKSKKVSASALSEGAADQREEEDLAPPPPPEPSLDYEAFTGLPADVFIEVCSYLSAQDLLNLDKTNKHLRSIMLSPTAQPIWAACRRIENWTGVDFERFSDRGFIQLQFGSHCTSCGSKYPTMHWKHFMRLCQSCARQQTISLNDPETKQILGSVHPQLRACVAWMMCERREVPDEECRGVQLYYPTQELADVNWYLHQAAEQDELDPELQVHLGSDNFDDWNGSDPRIGANEPPEGSQVAKYVAERRRIVDEAERRASEVTRQNRERQAKAYADDAARQEKLWPRTEMQLAESGWSRHELDFLRQVVMPAERTQHHSYEVDQRTPRLSPLEQVEDWKRMHEAVRAARERSGQQARKDALAEHWQEVVDVAIDYPTSSSVYPAFALFCQLPLVERYWKPENSIDLDADEDVHEEFLEDAFIEIEFFRELVRMEGIRMILQYALKVRPSKISTDIDDYTKGKYGNEFFGLAMNSYVDKSSQESKLVPFPTFLFNYTFNRDLWFADLRRDWRVNYGRHHVTVYTALLEAAGLDPKTTTLEVVKQLPAGFTWRDCPKEEMRKIKMTYAAMVNAYLDEHVRIVRSDRKPVVPEIIFEAEETKPDVKSKSKKKKADKTTWKKKKAVARKKR